MSKPLWRFWFISNNQLKSIEEYYGKRVSLKVVGDDWYNRNCEYFTLDARQCERIFNDDLRFVQEWRIGYKETMIMDYKQDVEDMYIKLARVSYIKPDILVCRRHYEGTDGNWNV